jgi:hypothetical protein
MRKPIDTLKAFLIQRAWQFHCDQQRTHVVREERLVVLIVHQRRIVLRKEAIDVVAELQPRYTDRTECAPRYQCGYGPCSGSWIHDHSGGWVDRGGSTDRTDRARELEHTIALSQCDRGAVARVGHAQWNGQVWHSFAQ